MEAVGGRPWVKHNSYLECIGTKNALGFAGGQERVSTCFGCSGHDPKGIKEGSRGVEVLVLRRLCEGGCRDPRIQRNHVPHPEGYARNGTSVGFDRRRSWRGTRSCIPSG